MNHFYSGKPYQSVIPNIQTEKLKFIRDNARFLKSV